MCLRDADRAGLTRPNGATILLVEDEPAIRGLIARSLALECYRVIEARNGREALELFDGDVDLLLTDIVLPILDGREVIRELRRRRRTLKVLAISAYPKNAPDDPDVRFLAKPFTSDELKAAIRELLLIS